MSKDRIYKIVFFNQGNVVELYARQVGQSDLFGFIVEDLLFGGHPRLPGAPAARERERGERVMGVYSA